MKHKIIIIFLLFSFIITSGFGCKWTPKTVREKMEPITLNYWRVWDGTDAFRQVIAEYNKVHPNINIRYRKLRYDEYEEALLNALAEDRGPDIFSIDANWLGKYRSKIAIMPKEISLAYPVVRGTIKKEVIPEMRTQPSITLAELKKKFIDTVYHDVVFSYYDKQTRTTTQRIYGLPLSVDTLAMYYNQDLLNNAGIPVLSQYWNTELQQQIKKLTKYNISGEIIQSGIALGSGSNIARSPDILAALVSQTGSSMIKNNRVSFIDSVHGKDYNPGMVALKYYTQFADIRKESYSWNNSLANSLDMFIQGKLAIMFGYSYDLPIIRAQAPKLNFGVQKLAQIKGSDQEMNVANYWVETVSKKSKHVDEAWDFVQFITTHPEVAKIYLQRTKRPTALRSLIKEEEKDDDIGIFAQQLLTAHSWYKGNNYPVAEKAIIDMLDAIADNPDRLEMEAKIAVGKVKQTLN